MTYSFYVPRMASSFTEASVKAVFQNQFWLGTVKRVDFVPIEGESKFQKAFVHMETINRCESTDSVMNKVFNESKSVRMNIDASSYWVLLANKNPVAETALNNSQLAENANILQALVFKQSEEIARLQETVFNLTQRIFDNEKEQNVIFAYANYVKHGKYFDKGFISSDGNGEAEVDLGVGPAI
jgi:hypothetical protein